MCRDVARVLAGLDAFDSDKFTPRVTPAAKFRFEDADSGTIR